MKKVPLSKGIFLLPSLFTTAGMFFAYFSIIRSINGDYVTAAWAIFLASFFDLIDGRVARMTKTQSEFGKEYDSLVDLSSFGLAPALLIYTYSLSAFKPIGWFLSFMYFACVALRLARFNVRIHVVEKKKFQGLPSPLGANLLASLVIFLHTYVGEEMIRNYAAAVVTPVVALLMVSSIGYRSFKEYDLKKSNSFHFLLGVACFLGLVAINPEIVLFFGIGLYVISGPMGWIISLYLKKKAGVPVKVRTRGRKFSVVKIPSRAEARQVSEDIHAKQ